ncbi:hypothetical protein QBZ16_002060 [Prototheca wickerhamii]|uniref:DUF155 domain-containing protein n=1 Tax=Prototheca wickerhamii TaxID=3111 RepID=A0AAD9MLG0_PROWI|nr:hypothetical protein QBZ16_002060 [Prototheca wickerhamii]
MLSFGAILRASARGKIEEDGPGPSFLYRAEATYIGDGIDIAALRARPEFQGCFSASHRGALLLGPHQSTDPDTAEAEVRAIGRRHGPYLVAFPFGSVVMFGKARQLRERDNWLEACRSVAQLPRAELERPCTEGESGLLWQYTLTVRPDLSSWSQLTPETIALQQLDLKNIQVISQVLAVSVALDYYGALVERMLARFTAINREMRETLSLRGVNNAELLRLVAEGNDLMTDVITKLGVNDRFDIAWKYVQYGRIWDYLRSELEVDARFKTLDMKLNLVQDNIKYFLEIFQNRKSTTLEWIIIVLIAMEICLSLIEFHR